MAEFVWPEPTYQQLAALAHRPGITAIQDMRDAIHLDRQLLAGVDLKAASRAWTIAFASGSKVPLTTWILTRGGTVEPLPPTLAEALEAARLLEGEAAQVVTRYLQAQQQEGQADD